MARLGPLRYKPELLMTSVVAGDHAVVIGGSIAGLLAARVLARHFVAVTVLEKDALPSAPVARQGVPQGPHTHVLVQSGHDALEALFGDSAFDLASAGGVRTDPARDLKWFQFGVWKQRFESGLLAHWCDRPRLEHALRQQVSGLANLQLSPEHRVTGLIGAGGACAILGVRTVARGQEERELLADLVVDATGSGSRAPRWLEDLGCPRVGEDLVKVEVGYASRIYRWPAHASRDWTVLVIYPKPPQSRRAGILYPLDGERCLVTLIGWVGDHPPADERGFLDFARSLPRSDLSACLEGAEPLSPIRRHVFPASRWRRFERMAPWPENFVVAGDAVCRFNPVYGQGVTVSALDAMALARALERPGSARAPGFARRLQRELAGHRQDPLDAGRHLGFPFPGGHGEQGSDLAKCGLAPMMRPLAARARVRVRGAVASCQASQPSP